MQSEKYFLLNPSPACITDENQLIISVNEAFCAWTGKSEEGLIGFPMELIFQRYNKVFVPFASKQEGRLEREVFDNDQNQIIFFFSLNTTQNNDFENLSLVARYTTNAVVITDAKGRIEWINDGFTNLTYYTLAECIGKKPGYFLQGPLTSLETQKNISRQLRENKPFRETILNYRKDGSTYWVELQISPVFDENGVIKKYVSVESDITEKREREIQLQETSLKLAQANEELHQMTEEISAGFEALAIAKQQADKLTARQEALFNNTGLALIVFSKRGRIAAINDTALNWLKYSREELVDKRPPLPFLVESEMVDIMTKITSSTGKYLISIEECMKDPEIAALFKQLEWTFLPKFGEPIKVSVSLSQVVDENEIFLGYILAAQDITYKLKLEQELRENHKRLTDSLNYAQRIQMAIIPNERDISLHLSEFFVFLQAKDLISGDFFWYSTHLNKIFVACADCTGHGVPGGLLSMLGSAILNEIVDRLSIYSPEFILYELNNMFTRVLRQDKNKNLLDGMDIAICVIDTEHKTLEFAGAARPLLVVEEDISATVYRGSPYCIGGQLFGKEKIFEKYVISEIEKKTFFMFSDGFQSQFGGNDKKKFGFERLKNLLVKIINLPCSQKKEVLKENFTNWQRDEKQTDDVLVMGFRL